jgi:hypothetical protein
MTDLNTIQQDIKDLPEEAKVLLVDFIQILKKRYPQTQQTENLTLNLEDQPFIGIWSDRPETQDSSQWVRNIRQQNWRS